MQRPSLHPSVLCPIMSSRLSPQSNADNITNANKLPRPSAGSERSRRAKQAQRFPRRRPRPAGCPIMLGQSVQRTGACCMNGFYPGVASEYVVFPVVISLFAGCLTSQQRASVSQGRIHSDNFTCCRTQTEVADPTFCLTQPHYTGRPILVLTL